MLLNLSIIFKQKASKAGLRRPWQVPLDRQEWQSAVDDAARWLADRGGSKEIAAAQYIVDGRAVAEGEVHGVDGVISDAPKDGRNLSISGCQIDKVK